MSVDGVSEIDGLAEWLGSVEAGVMQRRLEEKLIRFLFSQDEAFFLRVTAQLALIGARPEDRPALVRDVMQIRMGLDGSIELCKHGVVKAANAVGHFFADHGTEILVGAAIVATGFGIAYVTGYTLSASVGGVVVAGAGSVFSREKENPYAYLSKPIPYDSSKQGTAETRTGFEAELPKLNVPPSLDGFFLTPTGIWANGTFYSNDWLKHSHFAEEFLSLYPNVALPPPVPDFQLPLQDFLVNREDVPLSLPSTQPNKPPSRQESIEELFGRFLGSPEKQLPPLTSERFTLPSTSESLWRGCIGWTNGICNTFAESRSSAQYIQGLANGHAVNGIYNCTHGLVGDLSEAAILNHHGLSPHTAGLIQEEWKAFHEANADRPNAKAIWICHSQGTLHVKNALLGSPPEIRDRIIVVAIAPAAVVPNELCFKSYNYASETDIVHRFAPYPSKESGTIDGIGVPNFDSPLSDYRDELIILPKHDGVTWWKLWDIDHGLQSPTFRPVIKDAVDDYEEHGGEYLPEEKGRKRQ